MYYITTDLDLSIDELLCKGRAPVHSHSKDPYFTPADTRMERQQERGNLYEISCKRLKRNITLGWLTSDIFFRSFDRYNLQLSSVKCISLCNQDQEYNLIPGGGQRENDNCCQ